MSVKTDLHAHFAGVLSPDQFLALGLRHGCALDVPTAKRLGIVDAQYDGDALPLATLDSAQMRRLKAGLALPDRKQSLFDDLDQLYANRSFITKDPSMFVPLLEATALGYAEQGVRYAEMSFAGILSNPGMVRALHENLPRIEAETGVRLRFLGALWRHSDLEWNKDEVDRLKEVIRSPYVVGLDIMGHEKNAIRELAEPLQDAVRYGAENVPGFTIRIHAGENPYYSAAPNTIDEWNYNNTYESISLADSARRLPDGRIRGAYGDQVQIRIGHGRYGIHDETLDLMANSSTTAELCLSSNLLLNHADSYAAPFNLYAQHSVPFVLGSDGYGIYHTTLPMEYSKAVEAGMNKEADRLLQKTEDSILIFEERRHAAKMAMWQKYDFSCAARNRDPFEAMGDVRFSTPDGQPRWTPAVAQEKARAEQAKLSDITGALNAMDVNTDSAEIESLLQSREVLLFSGASKGSWKTIPPEQQVAIIENMRAVINALDPEKFVLVTGGTDHGFEAVIHKLAEERNAASSHKLPVVGALTLEANIDEIRPGTLSHAMVLNYGTALARSWMDQSPALLDMVMRTGAHVIMAGGGQVIRDMIVDCDGRGLMRGGNVMLFAGINGASGEKAGQYPGAAFTDAQTVLARLGLQKTPAADFNAATDPRTRAVPPDMTIISHSDVAGLFVDNALPDTDSLRVAIGVPAGLDGAGLNPVAAMDDRGNTLGIAALKIHEGRPVAVFCNPKDSVGGAPSYQNLPLDGSGVLLFPVDSAEEGHRMIAGLAPYIWKFRSGAGTLADLDNLLKRAFDIYAASGRLPDMYNTDVAYMAEKMDMVTAEGGPITVGLCAKKPIPLGLIAVQARDPEQVIALHGTGKFVDGGAQFDRGHAILIREDDEIRKMASDYALKYYRNLDGTPIALEQLPTFDAETLAPVSAAGGQAQPRRDNTRRRAP